MPSSEWQPRTYYSNRSCEPQQIVDVSELNMTDRFNLQQLVLSLCRLSFVLARPMATNALHVQIVQPLMAFWSSIRLSLWTRTVAKVCVIHSTPFTNYNPQQVLCPCQLVNQIQLIPFDIMSTSTGVGKMVPELARSSGLVMTQFDESIVGSNGCR